MTSASERGLKCYGEEDVAAFIRSLDRDEDHHIFAEDVVKTYPYLAQSYAKVCPRRCDLATAAQKALEGAYSYDVKMAELRADVALMVSNCIAFNGPTSAYAEAAARFERFAVDSIDRFVAEHNGGRRASRLRLQPVGGTSASLPSSSQPELSSAASGKRGSVANGTASAGTPTFVVPQIREVVQLVDGLNRREDGNAFAVDVAAAYPDLRASYEKMCPTPMNLRMMHQRAKEGVYTSSTATQPLFGATVAASFTVLRADVELLVRNCITFNAKVDSWVTLAHSFQAFAHHRIDDFVLRHAAALRGTQTGVQLYATGREGDGAGAPAAAVAVSEGEAAPSPSRRKRERNDPQAGRGSGAAVPTVSVVADVVPQVAPTPLQPLLVIPPRLRRRLAFEHLRHTALPLRRVGVEVPHAELYPASPTAASSASPTGAAATVAANVTAGHVLRLLRQSIADVFAERRRRPDFADAFAFSQREEHVYQAVLRVVSEEFEHTAAHILLYERESAELAEWTALCGLQGAAATEAPPRLSDALHYLYLVRFLVQWPQLACLCCTSATPAVRGGATASGGAAQAALRISHDQLRAMAQVTLITQEFLNFVEKVDEQQQQQQQQSCVGK